MLPEVADVEMALQSLSDTSMTSQEQCGDVICSSCVRYPSVGWNFFPSIKPQNGYVALKMPPGGEMGELSFLGELSLYLHWPTAYGPVTAWSLVVPIKSHEEVIPCDTETSAKWEMLKVLAGIWWRQMSAMSAGDPEKRQNAVHSFVWHGKRRLINIIWPPLCVWHQLVQFDLPSMQNEDSCAWTVCFSETRGLFSTFFLAAAQTLQNGPRYGKVQYSPPECSLTGRSSL